MGTAERQRRHDASMERIQRMQRVVGQGDRLRVDHEGTVLERARLMVEELRSHEATELGLAAFDRLLRLAEEQHPCHHRDIVCFIAAIWNNQSLPLVTLRGLDQAIGDDMMAVLDAFRYGRLNLAEQVEGGPARVVRAVRKATLAKA